MSIPQNLKYTKDHEWIRVEGGEAFFGVTEHAQQQLGDIVFVDLPETGRKVSAGDSVCSVESVKAVNDVFSALSGEITGGNDKLEGDPALVNSDPYGEGWMFKLRMDDPSQADGLMDAAAYAAFLEDSE